MKNKRISNVIIVKKFFTLKQNLKIHIKNVHEGKRNYKYDTHMKYITKYKCNYCDSCGKFFTESIGLGQGLGKWKKHIKKIHTK